MSTPSSDSTLYKCEVCNKTFNSQQEIERHNKEKHIETAGQKEQEAATVNDDDDAVTIHSRRILKTCYL